MTNIDNLPARFHDLLSRDDHVEDRYTWSHCEPHSRDEAVWWLADLIVTLRCGGLPDYYDLWRSNVNGEGVVVAPTQTRVLQTLATNLLPSGSADTNDHEQGLVAEHIWFALTRETDAAGRTLVRIEEPGWSVTDQGADGLAVFRVDGDLTFRLWETKKHDAEGKVGDTVNRACRQLDSNGIAYLARMSKTTQEAVRDDDELAGFYGRMPDMWGDGDAGSGAGVSVTTSDLTDWDDCFAGLPNYFAEHAGDRQREGLITRIPEFDKFTIAVREAIWKGL
ncbi:MAG TPA: hypothetical protein PKD80_02435 [Microthrixaceae bacterium]|nr:hypothetical protein [Microthrixaceae bacterium]HMT23843.1 hypothetical protein [Microthrixaceae bacterium]HMT62449.1 hypothetical protein [Microthrixaceae bacterium]